MKLSFLFMVLALGACDCKTETVVDAGPDHDAADSAAPDGAAITPTLNSVATLTFDESGEPANIRALALSPDGRTMVATGWDGRVVFFDIASGVGTERHMFGTGNPPEEHAAVWNGDHVGVGSFSGLTVFDAEGAIVGTANGRANSVAALDNGFVVVGSNKVTFVGVDATIGRTVDLDDAYRVSFATTNLYVSTDHVDTALVALDPATFAELDRVEWVDWDVFGAGQWNIGIQLTHAYLYDGLDEVGEFDTNGVTFDAFSVDGTWAAGTGHNDGVVLFDMTTRRALASAELDTRRSEAIVLDGTRRIFVGSGSGVHVYDIIMP